MLLLLLWLLHAVAALALKLVISCSFEDNFHVTHKCPGHMVDMYRVSMYELVRVVSLCVYQGFSTHIHIIAIILCRLPQFMCLRLYCMRYYDILCIWHRREVKPAQSAASPFSLQSFGYDMASFTTQQLPSCDLSSVTCSKSLKQKLGTI